MQTITGLPFFIIVFFCFPVSRYFFVQISSKLACLFSLPIYHPGGQDTFSVVKIWNDDISHFETWVKNTKVSFQKHGLKLYCLSFHIRFETSLKLEIFPLNPRRLSEHSRNFPERARGNFGRNSTAVPLQVYRVPKRQHALDRPTGPARLLSADPAVGEHTTLGLPPE
jgi:hypothetical protein